MTFLLWTGSYRHDGEDGSGSCMSEQDVDERDDLQGLAQSHAVCQNAAEPTAGLIALQRLHQVIIQETDPTNLQRMKRESRSTIADIYYANKAIFNKHKSHHLLMH